MFPKSIRARLALSYALLVLFGALALGLVQLGSLRSYYEGQEREFLQKSAAALGQDVANFQLAEVPQDSVESLMQTFSVLANTQVRLLSPEDEVLFDSGVPADRLGLSIIPAPKVGIGQGAFITVVGEAPQENGDRIFTLKAEGPVSNIVMSSEPGISFQMSVPFSPNMICESANADDAGCLVIARSSQSVKEAYYSLDGSILGYVELSQSPAFGAKILRDVTSAGILAGGVAVLLAAAIGWFLSRGLTAPLSSLTRVTNQMAERNLSARADESRSDEFGQLSKTFNQMATRIENTVKTLRQFVSDAAHEIFTPMTAVRTQLELALQAKDNRTHLDQALTQLTRLEDLTANLLDLSRLESNENTTERALIKLDQVVARIAESFAAQAEQAGVTFTISDLKTSIPIVANEKQIEQLISNLLSNAVKFTPTGGDIRITLSEQDDFARILVEDTGIGIPAEDFPHLFERFHRGRNTAQIAGSGLGLPISKAIVLRHGGKIKAVERAHGACFIIDLPLH